MSSKNCLDILKLDYHLLPYTVQHKFLMRENRQIDSDKKLMKNIDKTGAGVTLPIASRNIWKEIMTYHQKFVNFINLPKICATRYVKIGIVSKIFYIYLKYRYRMVYAILFVHNIENSF